MRKGAVAGGVVALALAVALGWWLRRDPAAASDASTLDAAAVASRPAAPPAPLSQPQPQPQPPAPLPAPDAPLTSTYAELRRRADAGEPQAACRLAWELDACVQVREQLVAYEDRLDRMEHARQHLLAEHRDAIQASMKAAGEALLKWSSACDGVPLATPQERVDLWRQAALAGQPGALAHYAVGNAFRLRSTLSVLPELERYRREAEPLALQAAARGDVQTMLALAAAYSPRHQDANGIYLAQVVEPDASRALALFRRGRALLPASAATNIGPMLDGHIAWLMQNTSAAEQAQADQLDLQWDRDWLRPSADAAQNVSVGPTGGVRDIAASQCAG